MLRTFPSWMLILQPPPPSTDNSPRVTTEIYWNTFLVGRSSLLDSIFPVTLNPNHTLNPNIWLLPQGQTCVPKLGGRHAWLPCNMPPTSLCLDQGLTPTTNDQPRNLVYCNHHSPSALLHERPTWIALWRTPRPPPKLLLRMLSAVLVLGLPRAGSGRWEGDGATPESPAHSCGRLLGGGDACRRQVGLHEDVHYGFHRGVRLLESLQALRELELSGVHVM